MRFLRHDGIYRSDVSLLLVNPAQVPPPVGRPRCRAIVRDGRSTPCPSSAMSSGRLFLDRGGRHQSPSPLHRHPQNKSLAFRRASNYHRTASSVLTVCVSRGDKRIIAHDRPRESCTIRNTCGGWIRCWCGSASRSIPRLAGRAICGGIGGGIKSGTYEIHTVEMKDLARLCTDRDRIKVNIARATPMPDLVGKAGEDFCPRRIHCRCAYLIACLTGDLGNRGRCCHEEAEDGSDDQAAPDLMRNV